MSIIDALSSRYVHSSGRKAGLKVNDAVQHIFVIEEAGELLAIR